MRAFIAISLRNRRALSAEITVICDTLVAMNMSYLLFVDAYSFAVDQAKLMMETAVSEIRACDFLIAEASNKAIGVGVEVGYAAGIGKPIVYLRHERAEHSTTVGGVATHTVVYRDIYDLREKLSEVLALRCVH